VVEGAVRSSGPLYLSALKIDLDFAMVHAARGTAYYSHIYSNPTEGKIHLERALQLSDRTTDREAQIIRIEYERALGHFEKQRSLYEVFMQAYPDDSIRRYNYGGALRAHGRFDDAIAQ
jgi:tetratricopeptide (TPR) repeat protein